MEKVKLYEIVEAVNGSFGYVSDIDVCSISTDTRTLVPDSVFVALSGPNFDGHDYAVKAMQMGAVAVITDRAVDGAKCIIVDSTQKALLQLGAFYRRKFRGLKLVGVTGSVGKTSTKDMIALVLSKRYSTLKTQKNFNNEIGLPMTLFNLSSENEVAVIEMGMSNLGEISRLSQVAQPTLAVITNIGYSHIENLGTQESILKAKLEILDGADSDAPIIMCMDDKLLSSAEIRGERRKIYYSVSKKQADVFASDINKDNNGISFDINYNGEKINARVNVHGTHNVKNALAAFCVGLEYGVEPSDMVEAIAEFKTEGVRQNIVVDNSVTYFLDCYNASPDAMNSAFETLKDYDNSGRKIAVLADMLELGKKSKMLHRMVGEAFAATQADMLVCYGVEAEQIIEGAVKKGYPAENTKHFLDRDEMTEFLKSEIHEGDMVLFKGSHGMKLDEIYNRLK